MVTVKRRIATEQDRFGGYGIQPTVKTVTDETETAYNERYSFRTVDEPAAFTAQRERITEAPAHEESAPPVIEYSTRPYYGAHGYAAPAKTGKTRAKKSRREKEDVMPSIRTRAYVRPEEQQSEAEEPRAKMAGKTKIALIAYVVTVLALAVVVIATGLAVSNLNSDAARIEREIVQKNEQLMQINSDIAVLTDLDRIAGAAANGGMHKIEQTVEVDLLPTEEPVTYKGRSNWFDKICDWLSKIIGG
ncbi:MAG: hypothetical protein K2L51_02620 [Clostridiales bacterium]|nr:hypothetical protein [Clostridiales bacterium]